MEYVENGGDCTYGSGGNWAISQGGSAVSGITEDVKANLDLFATEISYLPYSSNIICEAYAGNFDASEQSWGHGTNPVTLSNASSVEQSDGSVLIPVRTSGTLAYVDLGADNTVYTVYVVGKFTIAETYGREFCVMQSRSTARGMLMWGSPIRVATWGSDSQVNVSPNNYFAAALEWAGSGAGAGIVGSAGSWITKSATYSGRYITIGRTDPYYLSDDSQNANPSDSYIKYIGVTSVAESESTVRANLAFLEQQFLNA